MSAAHRVSVDVLYQLPDEALWGRQRRRLMMKLTGLQHRQQVAPPHRHVLTHAQQQTLQLCADLDRLRRRRANGDTLNYTEGNWFHY